MGIKVAGEAAFGESLKCLQNEFGAGLDEGSMLLGIIPILGVQHPMDIEL
jgi:hypothetical protein